ncbi:MAG TPA: N-acetyl-gamma-glutamyl-phosphate reductase, partial [Afifellaceae bacterium]|nr:N-acetyl-gamma-glutamyl-phosphate reductase [Afifellaceae bacterium]
RELLNAADIAILCLPDTAAREAVAMIDNPATRVIDASSAHRTAPDCVYGFAEMVPEQAERIAQARFVANPGCYPQGLIALVRPLIEAGILPADRPVVYSAVSGYSGGGRQMIEAYEASGAKTNPFMPYGLSFAHKHLPEMTLYSGLAREPLFAPAVGNYAQGMIGTVPVFLDELAKPATGADLAVCLAEHFGAEGFVTVAPYEPAERHADLDPQALNGTNGMRLHVFANEKRGQALLVAVYDNLGKGASGAAVQNLNIMIGADQASGLDLPIAA